MADQVLKTVRITDNIKVEVYQQGKKRKYALFYDSNNTKSEKYDVAMSDDDVIKESLLEYGRLQSSKGKPLGQLPQFYYKVIQDPYKDPFTKRTYGNGDKSPYYLNNGCSINIEWEGWANSDPIITSSDDDAEKKKDSNDGPLVYAKSVTVYLPKGFTENGGKGYLVWTDIGLRYNDDKNVYKNSLDKGQKNGGVILKFSSTNKDSEIVEHIIASFVGKVTNLHGYDYRGLKLCTPNTEACSLIPYKSPLEPPNNTPSQLAVVTPGATQSAPKIKFTIDGLPTEIIIKAKEDLDTFTIWTGPIPKPASLSDQFEELDELDSEYIEGDYAGEEEKMAEVESPSRIDEVPSGESYKQDSSSVSSYTPDPNAKPGTVVSLPRDYSHTSTQGYNILDSKWIGDLIASAKSHIGHPTYDISGTENGNLGCASAVSMMFYRAFGVHMRDGKAVKAKPTDIGSFGTKGTSEAAGWFVNAALYQKIPWKDAQPGDILNTARNFSTNKAGHIGVVIDVKDKNGSWAVVSNSSKGFAGGGGGAVKQNYSVKAWQSVTDRNPSQTFAFRYIGPRLSSGQTA